MSKNTIGLIIAGFALAIGAFALGSFYASWQIGQIHPGIRGGMMGGGFSGGGCNGGGGMMRGYSSGGWRGNPGGGTQNNAAPASSQELRAVSQDGTQIPLAADAQKIVGSLAAGSAAQQVGDTIVVLSLNPYPATMRQPTEFSVLLKDAQGNAIDDAQVALNLTMPSMWMPPNKPALSFVSDGKYSGTGQFTMRGWWRVEVIVTRGGQTQSAFFDLGL